MRLLLEYLLCKEGEVDAPVAPDVAAVVLVVLVWVAVGVEVAAQLGVRLHEEIVLAYCYPIEFGLGGKEALHLRVELLVVLLHSCSCRLKAVVVELVGIEARDAECVAASHREACHGASRAFGNGHVVAVDIFHYVHEALFHRCFGSTLVECVAVRGVHAFVPPSGCCVAGRVAVGHDNNHRHCLTFGYEVVHYLRCTSQVAPRCLVASMSVQQVHHREAFLAIVGSRQIYGHATLLAQRGAVVPHTAQHSVRHVVHSVEVTFVVVAFAHDEYVAQRCDVAVDVAVGRVDESLTVDRETVGIEFGIELPGGHCPYSVVLFCHRKRLRTNLVEIARHAYSLGRWGEEVEGNGSVVVYYWRLHSGTLSQCLLSEAVQSHEAAADKEHKLLAITDCLVHLYFAFIVLDMFVMMPQSYMKKSIYASNLGRKLVKKAEFIHSPLSVLIFLSVYLLLGTVLMEAGWLGNRWLWSCGRCGALS